MNEIDGVCLLFNKEAQLSMIWMELRALERKKIVGSARSEGSYLEARVAGVWV